MYPHVCVFKLHTYVYAHDGYIDMYVCVYVYVSNRKAISYSYMHNKWLHSYNFPQRNDAWMHVAILHTTAVATTIVNLC